MSGGGDGGTQGVRNELEGLFFDDQFVLLPAEDTPEEKAAKEKAAKEKDAKDKEDAAAAKAAEANVKGGKDAKAVEEAQKAREREAREVKEKADAEAAAQAEIDVAKNYDPEMRQKDVRGEQIIKEKPPGVLDSEMLTTLDRQMKSYTPQRCGISLLDRLDAVIQKLSNKVDTKVFEDKVLEDMLGLDNEREWRHDVAIKLGHLMRKRKGIDEQGVKSQKEKQIVPAAQHWAKILQRTDELYVIATEMLPVFTYALQRVTLDLGSKHEEGSHLMDNVEVGKIKDPVRLHEKATDEYAARFTDGELPEACVTDVLRARVQGRTGTQTMELILLFQVALS